TFTTLQKGGFRERVLQPGFSSRSLFYRARRLEGLPSAGAISLPASPAGDVERDLDDPVFGFHRAAAGDRGRRAVVSGTQLPRAEARTAFAFVAKAPAGVRQPAHPHHQPGDRASPVPLAGPVQPAGSMDVRALRYKVCRSDRDDGQGPSVF